MTPQSNSLQYLRMLCGIGLGYAVIIVFGGTRIGASWRLNTRTPDQNTQTADQNGQTRDRDDG